MIAISLYVLSQLPGTNDGKYCVITDDKGAAGCIFGLFLHSNKKYAGTAINIYSTPKMVQRMYNLGILEKKEDIVTLLSINDSLTVKGLMDYDFDVRDEISLSAEELAEMIMTPNRISVIF